MDNKGWLLIYGIIFTVFIATAVFLHKSSLSGEYTFEVIGNSGKDTITVDQSVWKVNFIKSMGTKGRSESPHKYILLRRERQTGETSRQEFEFILPKGGISIEELDERIKGQREPLFSIGTSPSIEFEQISEHEYIASQIKGLQVDGDEIKVEIHADLGQYWVIATQSFELYSRYEESTNVPYAELGNYRDDLPERIEEMRKMMRQTNFK